MELELKNHKQLLMDFYLAFLSIPHYDKFRVDHMHLYASLRHSLAKELGETEETVQRIFERMAGEDKYFKCCDCLQLFKTEDEIKEHKCT